MLNIKFIRENPDIIKDAIRKKHISFDLNAFLELDSERKNKLREIEELRAKQNLLSEKIPQITDEEEKNFTLSALKQLKDRLLVCENEYKIKDINWKKAMLQIPNVPDISVPEGETDEENLEIRRWGEARKFDFEPKDHITLMKDLDLLDLERGSKVSGFRGYFLKNDAVMLVFSIWKFVFDEFIKKGFTPFIAPVMTKPENFVGTGWLPQGEEEVYKVQDNLYLSGTAEVSMMGLHQNEILNESELPKKYIALSWCFRREAGSHGKDTRGIYRLHEFIKIEQIVLCGADHEESVRFHEEITKNSEELMQALGIPYRVVVNCGGDLGLGQVKKYDIEAWTPSFQKYRETHSSSYFHDFQTRRLNIRYKDKEGNIHFVHSLNNTAIAVPRILISIIENYQLEDRSIEVPKVLKGIMGKDVIKS